MIESSGLLNPAQIDANRPAAPAPTIARSQVVVFSGVGTASAGKGMVNSQQIVSHNRGERFHSIFGSNLLPFVIGASPV